MRDENTPKYRSELQVTTASEVGTVPTLWALPGLLPCHHVSAILAPTGAGLTQLAVQICTHLAPDPSSAAGMSSKPAYELAISNLRSQISDLRSEISDPELPPSPNDSALPPLSAVSSSDAAPVEVEEDYAVPAVLFIGDREAAETIRARLTTAGADLRRILILTEVEDTDTASRRQTRRPVRVGDYRLISELLRQHKGIRLVIIDNAEDLFFDTNRIQRNRLLRQLSCFRALAEMREVNVCLLANIPRLDNDPFRTTLQSTLREVCRTVHLLAPDLPTPERNPQSQIPYPQSDASALRSPLSDLPTRLLFTLKNTLVSTCPTLRLNLFHPSGSSFSLPPSSLESPASSLLYPRYLSLLKSAPKPGPKPLKLDSACQVLAELLKQGPLPVGRTKRPKDGTIVKLTRDAGIAWKTVQRAMTTLNIHASFIGKRWHWQLPNTIPHSEQPPSLPSHPSDLQRSPAIRPSHPQNSTQAQHTQDDTQMRATPRNTPPSFALPVHPCPLATPALSS